MEFGWQIVVHNLFFLTSDLYFHHLYNEVIAVETLSNQYNVMRMKLYTGFQNGITRWHFVYWKSRQTFHVLWKCRSVVRYRIQKFTFVLLVSFDNFECIEYTRWWAWIRLWKKSPEPATFSNEFSLVTMVDNVLATTLGLCKNNWEFRLFNQSMCPCR